jgi:hypothetical protein
VFILVHAKIGSLVEIGIMWWKSWKFVCVGKFWCDGKIGSLKKKKFGTKHGIEVNSVVNLKFTVNFILDEYHVVVLRICIGSQCVDIQKVKLS